MYPAPPQMVNDAAVMCLVAALALGGAMCLILGYHLGQALREWRLRPRPQRSLTRSEPEPAPVRMRVVGPGPLWANNRLWEDPALRQTVFAQRPEFVIEPLSEIAPRAGFDDLFDLEDDDEPALTVRYERGARRRL